MATDVKEERVLPPTRRPDGTMRKPVRIRAGYVAQDEVAIYQSKGALLKKSGPQAPPGYAPEDLSKPKTKSAKKNEKRKEKKQQARVNGSESETAQGQAASVEALTQRLGSLEMSSDSTTEKNVEKQPENKSVDKQPECETAGKADVLKRIRALKKKIRLATESQQESSSSQHSEKLAKVEAWQKKLKELESEL